MRLEEAMESAVVPDEHVETPPSDDGVETQTTEESPETEETPGQFIGIEEEKPEKSESSQEPTGEWELKFDPEEVIALVDGKPITAGEIKSGYMRQSDYTKKTTEIAEYRKQAEAGYSFVEQNRAILEKLATNDPDKVLEALTEVAGQYGVDLGKVSQASQPRGPDGKFASTKTENAGAIDLSEYEPDSEAYKLGSALNQALEKNQSLETKMDNFMKQFEQSVTTHSQMESANAIAEEWKGRGMKDIDVENAVSLVGQPISVEQAMVIQNFQNVIRHTISVAKSQSQSTPSEPGSRSRKPGSMAGMSLEEAMANTVHE